MADPWVNWGWLKVGPFLGSEEERVGHERRAEELRAEEGRQRAADRRDKEGIMSLRPRGVSGVPGDYGPPLNNQSRQFQQDYGTDMVPPPAVGPSENYPFDPNLLANDMSLSEALGAGSRQWQAASENQRIKNMQPSREQIEATKDADMGPMPTPQPQQTAVNTGAGAPLDIAGQEVQRPTLTPDQQMIEDLKRQRAMVDAIYPQRPDTSGAYADSDAYALAERDRANSLAQLAFFSGVTQGAGGSWEGVGRGLAGAGKAYSEGFERYQKALSNRATRSVENTNADYQNSVARSDAALKLYQNEQDNRKGLLSEARAQTKERRDSIDDYFKKRLDLSKGNDFTPTDQSQVERIMRDWRLSRERGEIVETEDVRDPKK